MLRGLDANIPCICLGCTRWGEKGGLRGILREAAESPNNYVVSVQVLAETIYAVFGEGTRVGGGS